MEDKLKWILQAKMNKRHGMWFWCVVKLNRCTYCQVSGVLTGLLVWLLSKSSATVWFGWGKSTLLQPFHSQVQKVHSPNPSKEKCICDVVRIGTIIICQLSKLWKTKFFIPCDLIFLVRLQEKFDIDHSWEWKGLTLLHLPSSKSTLDQIWIIFVVCLFIHCVFGCLYIMNRKSRRCCQTSIISGLPGASQVGR